MEMVLKRFIGIKQKKLEQKVEIINKTVEVDKIKVFH